MKTTICPHCGKPNKPILDIIRELIREEERNFRKPVAVTLPQYAKDLLEEEVKIYDFRFFPNTYLGKSCEIPKVLGLFILTGTNIEVASKSIKVNP